MMPDAGLLDELTEQVGSRREATWILEAVSEAGGHLDAARARAIGARRAGGEPLQYLLGSWPFRGIELLVDPRALIPRPETEQVVEIALAAWRRLRPGGSSPTIVDLGTGSGAMGLSVAIELAAEAPELLLSLCDISTDALGLAASNAQRLGVSAELVAGSWFDALDPSRRGTIDLLVSNPPYVPRASSHSLAIELSYEPALALFSDDAEGVPGLADAAQLIEEAPRWLSPGGILVIEMGEGQLDSAAGLARRGGLVEVSIHEDLAGKPRALCALRP